MPGDSITAAGSISRRELLRRAGQGAALAAVPTGLLAACGGGSDPADVDIAIVGGGPSGTYAAYRLLTGGTGSSTHRRPRVAVFEGTNRLGGRIWSVAPPGAPHLIAEFGGMRFLNSQEIVPRLLRALNLPHVPFSKGNGNNIYYLRGRRFTASQFSDPLKVPYSLPPDERGLNPAQLMLKGVDEFVPGAETLSPAAWERVKQHGRVGGELLADKGFWNLMEVALSDEGYALVSDSVGYPSLFENWNAVEQMSSLASDLGPSAEYRTVSGGYQRLPATLGSLARRSGAAIHLNSRVVSIAPLKGGRVKLTVRGAGGATRTVTAGHVILAIPSDPLNAVVEGSPFLQQSTFTTALATVGTTPSSKTFLTFATPWWEKLGIPGGSSVTDLPILKCWYFGTEGRQPGANPANTTSLLMTYNDLGQADYWSGYLPVSTFSGPPAPRTSPPELVAGAIEQLSELHGISVPRPVWSGFINWENLPYGNAFHFWNVNAHSWEVIPYLQRPFDGVGMSICGDCWSGNQNWIESGLSTTESLLQSQFGYRPPSWLPEGAGLTGF
jgi:lysine 2-monooxygenase